ncbi:MAG TPA: hypothetical protein VKX16_11445 [Chloroflexota bacterium]|nr:hypothetical protein [Chloroflexota bacterium]
MRTSLLLPLVLLLAAPLAGCGGPDRTSLATSVVQTYWSDIGHGKFSEAYNLLTSGTRATINESQYTQNLMGFLEHLSGVSAKVGTPQISSDNATVPVTLRSPLAPSSPFRGFQHLFWQDGGWKISDTNGGLSQTR